MQTPTMRPSYPATPKATRKLKTPVSDSDSCLSPKLVSRTPKERTPKPKVTEIKRKLNKVSELETEIAHLQEELKMTKDQLNSSETLKARYQLEVEEAKRKLAAVSAKLDETEKQLGELSESEDARVQELLKISHDRDRVWQSELETVQKQHAMDSAALASAINEISRLKIQLEKTAHSEATLRAELEETISLVEELRDQLNDSRQSEARASAQSQRFESLLLELEGLKNDDAIIENGEIDVLRNEVAELRIALKGAERMYHEEYIQSTLDIRNAYGLLEQAKSDFLLRESALKDQIKMAGDDSSDQINHIMEQNAALKCELDRRRKEADSAEGWKSEMEVELRKVKVQCDQWRKAAEAAAAMLSENSVRRKVSHKQQQQGEDGAICDDDDDDEDDETAQKRNGNMLKKITVLLKKGHK